MFRIMCTTWKVGCYVYLLLKTTVSGCERRFTDMGVPMAVLKIRVVLLPQSTKTSVGPPDNARWSKGKLTTKEHYLKKKLIGTDHCYAFISFSVYMLCIAMIVQML